MTPIKLFHITRKNEFNKIKNIEECLDVLKINFFECTLETLTYILKEQYVYKRNIFKYIKDVKEDFTINQYKCYLSYREKNPKDNNSKNMMISKYGKLNGIKKFENMTSRIVSTLDNFIKRHGKEEGTKLYYEKNHRHSRKMKELVSDNKISMDKNSLKFFTNKYGVEEGTKLYRNNCVKLSFNNTLPQYISKYGEEGTKRYEEKNKKIAGTKENFKKWYGDKWLDKWNKKIKSNCVSLTAFKERYGVEEGERRFNNYIAKMRDTLENKKIWVKREDKSLYAQYHSRVQSATKNNNLNILKDSDKRGTSVSSNNPYHLDHIISIKQGFENNILPYIIGSISNLQFITEKENTSKGFKSYSVISQCEHIKEKYENI